MLSFFIILFTSVLRAHLNLKLSEQSEYSQLNILRYIKVNQTEFNGSKAFCRKKRNKQYSLNLTLYY